MERKERKGENMSVCIVITIKEDTLKDGGR